MLQLQLACCTHDQIHHCTDAALSWAMVVSYLQLLPSACTKWPLPCLTVAEMRPDTTCWASNRTIGGQRQQQRGFTALRHGLPLRLDHGSRLGHILQPKGSLSPHAQQLRTLRVDAAHGSLGETQQATLQSLKIWAGTHISCLKLSWLSRDVYMYRSSTTSHPRTNFNS